MTIKLWFTGESTDLNDHYMLLEGVLILVEPQGDKLKATVQLDDRRHEVICKYITTLP